VFNKSTIAGLQKEVLGGSFCIHLMDFILVTPIAVFCAILINYFLIVFFFKQKQQKNVNKKVYHFVSNNLSIK
jgi:hypothetical protein